jgi:hypothetical protein
MQAPHRASRFRRLTGLFQAPRASGTKCQARLPRTASLRNRTAPPAMANDTSYGPDSMAGDGPANSGRVDPFSHSIFKKQQGIAKSAGSPPREYRPKLSKGSTVFYGPGRRRAGPSQRGPPALGRPRTRLDNNWLRDGTGYQVFGLSNQATHLVRAYIGLRSTDDLVPRP